MKNLAYSIFVFALILFCGAVAAAEAKWSFMRNPHPGYVDKTDAEDAKLKAARDRGDSYIDRCRSQTRAAFEIYLARYPEYLEYATEERRWYEWKRHILTGGMYGERHCIFQVPFMLMMEFEMPPNFVFCGRFSAFPTTQKEREFVDIILELVDHALLGMRDPIFFLHLVSDIPPALKFNPDIDYYLRRWLEKDGIEVIDVSTDHLVGKLTPEHRKFIDQAVERDDLKLILEETPPCSQTY